MEAFRVVEQFEEAVAKFAGAPYAVATMTGTWAIFLALKLRQHEADSKGANTAPRLKIPARTFISVPLAALDAGYRIELTPMLWAGAYTIDPLFIVDAALRFQRKMFHGGLMCLSFQARKILNIGEGGMILTDSRDAADWLRAARYSGREAAHSFNVQKVRMRGWQAYMSPEKAARGLHLMAYIGDGEPDMEVSYPDLREAPVFAQKKPSYTDPAGDEKPMVSA